MTIVPVLSDSGFETGERIADAIGGKLVSKDSFEADGFPGALKSAFKAGEAIVAVAATGAVVRIIAPLLSDKLTEPPVVTVAEDGSAVIPVLGGHHGANDLAREIGQVLEVTPAITTASDLAFDIALDDPPPGLVPSPENDFKAFVSHMLSGETVRLEAEVSGWLSDSNLPVSPGGSLHITVTTEDRKPGEGEIVYHPRKLALGVGCERGCDSDELETLVRNTLADAGLSSEALALVSSIDVKSDEQAVLDLADRLGVPAWFFSATELEAETPRLQNPSDIVFAEVGCHGVSEGAALASVGPDGELVVAKQKSARATCAIARSPEIINPDATGRARGHLSVIGIGPGTDAWRTPDADRLISDATDLVGYSLYLDLLGDSIAGKARHDFGLGEEEVRARAALDLAAEGRNVALVSSGDIGIYAMATLVFELLEKGGNDAWSRLSIEVTPGISAMQACAARIGAPLGHDFCTISLSDLLTPWEAIQRRLTAAAEGDFVVAFYNPVSMRRRTQLARAREILLQHRPDDTPVIIGRSLGREEEEVAVTTLVDLDPEQIDMLTMVIVGSSESRMIRDNNGKPRVYTPRGYSGKDTSQMQTRAAGDAS